MSTSKAASGVSNMPATTLANETNPRGIPRAVFIEEVEQYVGTDDKDTVETIFKAMQETHAKYKFMQTNSVQRRAGLEEKVPELQRSIEMVEALLERQEQAQGLETTFELADTLFARGKTDKVEEVYVWLGANVMLSYKLADAHKLLQGKLSTASKSLAATKEDLEFLREQIIITEVNVARLHNWQVKKRRERQQVEVAEGGGAGKKGQGERGEKDEEEEADDG